MEKYRKLFRQIRMAYEANAKRDLTLICKEGFYDGCPVLKLQKEFWTNDSMQIVPNQTGIFFSVWLDKEAIRKNRVKYNIHALKLRQLNGYKLTSNDFAKHFRKQFNGVQHQWPNVSVNYGPQTLMQGWINIVDKTLERDILTLMNRFARLTPIIDDLLAKHSRAARSF